MLESSSGALNVNAALAAPGTLTLQSTSGNIAFGQAAGVTGLTAGNTITLSAVGGAVVGNAAAAIDATTPGTLIVTAKNGIGDVDPLETAVAQLTADNTTAGSVQFVEKDSVTLSTTFRNQAANQSLSLMATDGSIDTSVVAVTTNGGSLSLWACRERLRIFLFLSGSQSRIQRSKGRRTASTAGV